MAGGETLSFYNINYQQYIDDANSAWTKLNFFHFPNPSSHAIISQPDFENLANGTDGLYRQITNQAEIITSLPMLSLDLEREQFTANYRSIIGESGDRNISLLYQNKDITNLIQTYAITITNPSVTITSPADGSVIQQSSSGSNSPTSDLVTVEFSLSWPDGHERNLKSADLVVTSPGGTSTAMTISAGAPLKFSWNIGEYTRQKYKTLTIAVKTTDEFGLTSTSQIVSLNIKYVTSLNTWLLYSLYAIVIILLVVFIVMFRRIKSVATTGAVGQFFRDVKTIITGRRRGKPVASLRVIEGPVSMLNEELPIYTESVKLGRDPNRTDFSFFTPDSNSSVGRLHCRIERVGGSWRIVALPTTESETFVDNQAIPSIEPYPLHSGQTVRMGYLAQQPVVFIFNVEQDSDQQTMESSADGGDRPTVVKVMMDKEIISQPDSDQSIPDSAKDSPSNSEDPFDDYRDK
jgi:hypothetical protein